MLYCLALSLDLLWACQSVFRFCGHGAVWPRCRDVFSRMMVFGETEEEIIALWRNRQCSSDLKNTRYEITSRCCSKVVSAALSHFMGNMWPCYPVACTQSKGATDVCVCVLENKQIQIPFNSQIMRPGSSNYFSVHDPLPSYNEIMREEKNTSWDRRDDP